MKMNIRLFNKLVGEPLEIQQIQQNKVSFFKMNDTPYFSQYASKGRFAIWTSNGLGEYRVLIEAAYLEAMKDFYEESVNDIWIQFLEDVTNEQKRINRLFLIPTMLVYVIVAVVASLYFPENVFEFLLGVLVAVFISNYFQNRLIATKVRNKNMDTQNKIRELMGKEKFEALIESQEQHYQAFFKFEEKPLEETSEASPSDDTKEV
jgi:hypothetical protein